MYAEFFTLYHFCTILVFTILRNCRFFLVWLLICTIPLDILLSVTLALLYSIFCIPILMAFVVDVAVCIDCIYHTSYVLLPLCVARIFYRHVIVFHGGDHSVAQTFRIFTQINHSRHSLHPFALLSPVN